MFGWIGKKHTLSKDDVDRVVDEIHDALIGADVPYEVVEEFTADLAEHVSTKIKKGTSPRDFLVKTVHSKLLDVLGHKEIQSSIDLVPPSITMMLGLQGSGKTTTIAKLTSMINKRSAKKGKRHRVLFASVDFQRPAAIDQLEVLATQVGAEFFRAPSTKTVEASKLILEHFKKSGCSYLFLDTAGRMHADDAMMAELKEVDAAVKPRNKVLVLDAMTGQESIAVARKFSDEVGFSGAILSKMDSDTRGGAAFSFRHCVKKPIFFVGCGEHNDDLESFVPDRAASRILGMGDLESLLERAEHAMKPAEKESHEGAARRFMSGNFTLNDFAMQLESLNSLGSLGKIASYLPGMQKVSPEALEKGQREMKKFKAILSSMTDKERLCPQILDFSRKKRISKGAGVETRDINGVLQKFEESQQFARMLKQNGQFKKLFR